MYCTPSSWLKDKSQSGFQKYFLSCLVFRMPQWQSCLIGLFFEDIHIQTGSLSVFWVTWSSSWHPKERLDLTHIMLSSGVPVRVTTRAVFGLAECILAWHHTARYFHQCWILMNGSYMSSAHQWLQWRWSSSRWKSPQKNFLIQRRRKTSCDAQIKNTANQSLKVHPSNPVNSTTAAAVTIISQWQRTLPGHNDRIIQCLMFSHFHTVPQSFCGTPRPILSSSHCVCVKKRVSPLGRSTGMPGWKAPGESGFWTSLVPLVWCSASLCRWVSLSGTPGGSLLQTLPTTVFEPPTLLTIPSSSECCYPVVLGRATGALNIPKYFPLWSQTTVIHLYI